MRMPRTKQINPRNLRDKIEEAQKELNETEDLQKDIAEAVTRGNAETVKGVKRKKIVAGNHQTKIPKSPLRTPARAKSKEKATDLPSFSDLLPDTSLLLREVHSLATQNGKQNSQTEGMLNSEVAIKTSKFETSLLSKLSMLPQSMGLNQWPVEDFNSVQPVKKGSTNSSSTVAVDNNECIHFIDCSEPSSCTTNTAFDVLLKAMEPELNTLAQECPSSEMQIEQPRPNTTISASSCITSNTPAAQSHAAVVKQEYVAGSHSYPCTSQTVYVATSGKSDQAQKHSVAHSQEQVPAKAGQQNQPVTVCSSFTNSLAHRSSQEKLKLQHIYSIAVTSSIISPQASVTQAFSQNQLVAKASSPLSVHPSSSTTQLPIAPFYNSAQIASVEQICNLLKVQKPKKQGKYVCEYCNRACAKPSVLLKHIRSHTGERPYPCETCGFSFKTKSNLYKHKKSHAHAIKLGLVLQPDSSELFLSHESDTNQALSIHSDVEDSGDSDDEGTADERQDDQGSLELEAAHVLKIPAHSEALHKGSLVSGSNTECILGDSSFQDSAVQVGTGLPKVIVYPVKVSPLRTDSPKVADPTSMLSSTQQQGDLKDTNVKPNITQTDFVKDSNAKQHQKVETNISEEHLGTAVGTTIHAQLQRQQATDCSQDQQGKCLLSPRSLGSTDSGYFSRSESADQTMSPPVPFMKGLPTSLKDPSKSCVVRMNTSMASVVQTVCGDKMLLSSGQMKPPLATKTLEERISKLISDNEAVVDDKQLDSVKPRRTSLSRRGSIDSPKSYIFKDSFQFDLKPMGRRTSSSSDIPKSPFTPTEKSKQVFLLSVPTLDCLPITRSNSMPTTSYSAVPTNVVPPPHPLRGSQSFDDKIGSLYDDVFVPGPATPHLQSGHARTLVRQAAVEDSSTTEGHVFGPARSVDESYGYSASNEFSMARSKSFVQGSNLDKIKKSSQGRGTMFECETCRNRYRKLENFENHKKFYCSELHGPKTKAVPRDSDHKSVLNSTQPQILHYRVANSTAIWEDTSQIRKRRKMKSVGDDDDESPTNDTSHLSKSITESECQNKLGNAASISKNTSTILGSGSISLQISHDELMTKNTEQMTAPKMLLHGTKQAVPVVQEKNEIKRQGAGISVIQHTNSLSRPSSFEKSDSFERGSPVSFQDANKSLKFHPLNTMGVQEENRFFLSGSHCTQVAAEGVKVQHHECQAIPGERNVPVQSLRLVRQHNIQVPEILVTEEPDKEQECLCTDQEKAEKFSWPQRSETLSKLPTEKLPPKKKRIRLAEMEHSSAESSFDSTLSRSLSRESSLSQTSSFSASFDKDDLCKNENVSKAETTNKSLEFLTIPTNSKTLGVPGPPSREMRRAASEQISCTQPSMEVADYRSKSFDCGGVTLPMPASLVEISTSKLVSANSSAGHIPLLERRRGPLVRQISLNIAPEKNQLDAVSFQRLQSSGNPSEEYSSGSQHPHAYTRTLCESVKSNYSLNLPSNEHSIGSSLNQHDPQAMLSQHSQMLLKGPRLGTQKIRSLGAGQYSIQEACFAPKYQLQIKTLHVGQQYPLGLPGAAGMEQTGTVLEVHAKLNDKVSKPYVTQPMQQTPDNCSGQMYQAAPFVVPVRIHSNIPSYGLAAVAPLPQILVTREQFFCKTNTVSMPAVKDQAHLLKSQRDPLMCSSSSQPASVFDNLICEAGIKNAVPLGSLNAVQSLPVSGLFPQQEATVSSKRMLSPANSLDIAMEKQQKRVKDESGTACTTGALSLHPLNINVSVPSKQKKPLLVRQICTTEPLESFSLDPEDKSSGVSQPSDVFFPASAESGQSGVSSFATETLKHHPSTSEAVVFAIGKSLEASPLSTQTSFLKVLGHSQERMSPGDNKENKQSSMQCQVKSGATLASVNSSDIQQLSFPSLKTATNFTWCFLLKRKSTHLLQNEQKTSSYSSWSINPNNPNPLGLPTKVALSLLNSKQKSEKSFYVQAIRTHFTADILVYSSKWKNNLLKRALVKQKATREFSNKENSEISTDQDIENFTKSEPRRVKIFDGGYKSNEEYIYVRGRGRGKYICEECGIRCKKPSMLKKHIRTHTDVRPYHCNYCNFSFKTKGNLTKHMKSKAHSKKCMDLGISVGIIDDQDIEEYGEKQRLGYDRSGFDAEDSDGPDDDDNDNEDEDEDSQAESVLSATPSVSASPQHHSSRSICQEILSADEEIRISDCFAGVHTDSMDGLPKALLTKMTVLSTGQSDCRSSGALAEAMPRGESEGNTQDRATLTDSTESLDSVPKSPSHLMYVDYPETEEALKRPTALSVTTEVTSMITTSTRLPSPSMDQSTQTAMVAPSIASSFPEIQEQKHEELQVPTLASPQTHLFSHLPLHSQQRIKTPYRGMIPVGGIHVVPAGLTTYSTFLPIQAGPMQLTIPAVSVIHRTTSALGDPACAVSSTANAVGVAEVNNVVPCIPIGQINMPNLQSLNASTLQPLTSLSMDTMNILGLASTNMAPQIHPSGLALNAMGLQVLTNPTPQSNSSPQTHIPGLQILNIALPTLIPSVTPGTTDGQGIPETPASKSKGNEITSVTSQVAPVEQQCSLESLSQQPVPSSEYQRYESPAKRDTEKSDSESPEKPKCNISSVQAKQASASEPPRKVNSDILSSPLRDQTHSLNRQVPRQKALPERQNTVEFSDGSSDDEDRLVIAT